MELSKKSRDFLDDLSVYLMSSGKSETEVKDIVSELEDHLLEAEQAGKDVDDVIGQSPKSYMQYIGRDIDWGTRDIDSLWGSKIKPVI